MEATDDEKKSLIERYFECYHWIVYLISDKELFFSNRFHSFIAVPGVMNFPTMEKEAWMKGNYESEFEMTFLRKV